MNNNQEPTDIFLWANKTDAFKKELEVELFLFNKNMTPYSTSMSQLINDVHINPLFLYGIINTINLGAGTGLRVRDIEEGDSDNMTLNHVSLDKVGRADTLVYLIENERHYMVAFDHNEHDFKRLKGIVARYTHPTDKSVNFYVIKLIQQSRVVTGGDTWVFNEGKFDIMPQDVSIKVPQDNQVLIVGRQDIYAFDLKKFETLFNYDALKIKKAEEIGQIIDRRFKLNMPTFGQGISFMARENKTNMKKLLDVDPELFTHTQVLDMIDDLAIELMTDDGGSIILMDGKDVGVFLDLISDNYVKGATGNEYIAKSKKPVIDKK